MEEIEFVKCPYCGERRKRLWHHIKKAHNKTMAEARVDFPNAKWYADSEVAKFANGAQAMLSNPENLDKLKVAGTNNLINFNKNQWTEAQRAKRSKIQSDKWKNLEYRAKWHETRMIPDNLTKCSMNKFKKKEFSNGSFRSSYENQCSVVLDQLGYSYEYEPFYVRYNYLGKNYSYSVDFYISSLNLIIEVKPYKFTQSPKNQAKMKGSIESGYNYVFLTERELWKDLEYIRNLLESSTTIERVAK